MMMERDHKMLTGEGEWGISAYSSRGSNLSFPFCCQRRLGEYEAVFRPGYPSTEELNNGALP